MKWLWPAEPRARVERTLIVLAYALLAVGCYQVLRRVLFPWDLFLWSESPFMTNMVKLSVTNSVFDGPADANSWVYSPGLEYLCFGLLRPLGLQLDVRACRAVSVAIGLLAAFTVSRSAALLLGILRGEISPARDRAFERFTFAAVALLLFRNFTSDVCHPDNLYIAHASVSLYLCLRAASSGSYRAALLAVLFAGLGVLTKQTASFGFVGILCVLVLVQRGRRSWPRHLGLVAVGTLSWVGATLLVLSSASSRFFLVEVLSHHEVAWHRVIELLRAVFHYPHRVVLVAAWAFAVLRLIASRKPGAATFLACWAALATEVLPALGAYLKTMGGWNNLAVIDLWLATLAIPVTWDALSRSFGLGAASEARDDAARAAADPIAAAVPATVLALLVALLVPLKMPPTRGQYAFGRALEAAIREDQRAGRSVLLPHGMTPLVRAGLTTVPRDRSNSVLELRMAGLESRTDTKARIEGHRYDRIYLFVSDFYGPEILGSIEREYHEVGVLPGDGTPVYADDYLAGSNGFMRASVRVMAAN